MPKVILVLYRDFSNYDQFQRSGAGGFCPYANRMHAPEKPSKGPLATFVAEVQNGPIGAIFWWDPTIEGAGTNICSQRLVPLQEHRELPYAELHQEEWDRADMMKRAQDLLAEHEGSDAPAPEGTVP
ncbi:hypothetical protein [Nocardia sp. NPDC057227]|uniref:hypothetical protein n=1 Tax=Nocardia sp. NPDC057227 TaxID=3346056 RepID=UPI003625C62A